MPLAENLKELLGAGKVSTQSPVLETHATDKWFASTLPDVVVFAESVDDVSRVLKFANERKIPVTTRGAGVGYVGGCVPALGGIALSVARMNRIIELNPVDAVAVVEPGVITGDLQQEARDAGMCYPPDPASLKECSLGGNIATNAGGPRCLKYGVTRQYVLGLEAVLANGEVLRTGGRCHKNKTGFDLIGMFVGSEGMLGVVTQATLRLIPNPPTVAMLSAGFATYPEAAAAVQAVFAEGHLPSALEIADQFTLAAARDHLGASMVPEGGAHLLLEIDGHPEPVASQLALIREMLEKRGPLSLDTASGHQECNRLWDLRREFSYSLRATGLTKLNQDIVVPRSRLVDLVDFVADLQKKTGFAIASFGHAGDGNIHVNIMVDDIENPTVEARANEALDQLFHQVLAWDGVISGEHGIGIAKQPWFRDAVTETAFKTHLALKQALDPNGILNPGKFL